MMRTKDELYQSLGLDNPALTKDELLKAISENSALLERPIVVNGKKLKLDDRLKAYSPFCNSIHFRYR